MHQSEMIEALYKRDGYYEQLSNLVHENGQESGRGHVLAAYNQEIPMAVLAQQAAPYGLLSITVGETPTVISQDRWRYRVLLPSESEGITELHTSIQYAGRLVNRLCTKPTYVAGYISYPEYTQEEIRQFSELYIAAIHLALSDIKSICS